MMNDNGERDKSSDLRVWTMFRWRAMAAKQLGGKSVRMFERPHEAFKMHGGSNTPVSFARAPACFLSNGQMCACSFGARFEFASF